MMTREYGKGYDEGYADGLKDAIEQAEKQEPFCYFYIENGEEFFAPKGAYVPDNAKPLYPAPPQRQPLTDAVINAAREALDASFEAGNDEMDISIPAHLAAALSMRLDEYDAAHGIKGEV